MTAQEMKKINIKGKDYVEVHERIGYLRKNYKVAQLLTEILSNEGGVCIMKATLYVDDKIVSTGHAYEKEDSTYINKTSYIENCETSAVGRCLGNFGIGINSSIASADEVVNAINQQQQKPREKNEWEEKLLSQAKNDESVLIGISDSWKNGIKTEKQYYWFSKQLVDKNYL
jgi:hypothetical protein